jgi:hypothetical protein
VVGLGEGALDVAEAQLLVVVAAVILEAVLRVGLVDDRRAGFERLLDVEHRRQRLVVDPDLRQRLESLALAVCDHRDDRLALVADLVDRERRLVVLAEVQEAQKRVEVPRHVGAADHAPDAGRALGRARVDAADAGMVARAAQDLEVEEARELVVVEIGRRSGDVADHVLALRRLADLVEVLVALVGKVFLAEFQHGSFLRRAAGPGRRSPPPARR